MKIPFLAGTVRWTLVAILFGVGADFRALAAGEPPPPYPGSVLFTVATDRDGKHWVSVTKPGGAVQRFHIHKSGGGIISSADDVQRFQREETLPEFVDVEWRVEQADIVPDRRHFQARLPIRSRVPDEVPAAIEKARVKRDSASHELVFKLKLEEIAVEMSWEYRQRERTKNPLRALQHVMSPAGVPAVVTVLQKGGPWRDAVQALGEAPRLTDEEREAIRKKNAATEALMRHAMNKAELTDADGPWIAAALADGADVDGLSVYQRMQGTEHRPQATPLMLAAGNGTSELIALLLKHGAQINAGNEKGTTALMYAVIAGKIENVKHLLRRGADPKIRRLDGQTALSLARQQSFAEIESLLRKAGAKE